MMTLEAGNPIGVEIKVLRAGDRQILQQCARGVFDDALEWVRTEEFLADPRHHLIVAIENGLVVGFISAVHYVHPDKAHPELWINEVGVAPEHRRRGIGRLLLHGTLRLAQDLNCSEAWVLTSRSNAAAMELYGSVGGRCDSFDDVMFTFKISQDDSRVCRAPTSPRAY